MIFHKSKPLKYRISQIAHIWKILTFWETEPDKHNHKKQLPSGHVIFCRQSFVCYIPFTYVYVFHIYEE